MGKLSFGAAATDAATAPKEVKAEDKAVETPAAEAKPETPAAEAAPATEVKEVPVEVVNEAAAAPDKTVTVPESAAPATRPAGKPAVYVEGEDVEGEITQRDMKLPNIIIVQKTSDLTEIDGVSAGDFMIAKEIKVGSHKTPFRMVVLKAKKQYQEQLPFGSGVKPRIFSTMAEVEEAGLHNDWNHPEKDKRCAEILRMVMWIPQPEDVDAPHIFTIESPEGFGALVGFTAAKTTYGTVAKAVLGASSTFLTAEKGGLRAREWLMWATFEKNDNNSWYLPRIKPGAVVTKPQHEFYTNLLHSSL